MLTKPPPHNLDAEQSTLGAIFFDNKSISTVAEILQADDFYSQKHRLIYETVLSMYNAREPVDLVTVTDKLRNTDLLETIGGATYVATLTNFTPTAANVAYHAGIVRENSIRRKMISKAMKIIETAQDGAYEDLDSFVAGCQADICSVQGNRTRGGLKHIKAAIHEVIAELEQGPPKDSITGIPTGFTDLDRMTSGLQPANLIILAARPSMGKTALAMQIADNAALKKVKTAVFSLEMSTKQLVKRSISNAAMVDGTKVRNRNLNAEEWEKVADVARKMYVSESYIDDSNGITVMDVCSRCRRMKQDTGLGLVVIDYLQLIRSNLKNASVNQQVGEITSQLKAMAKELDVPVLCLSQLSRAVEQRQDKHPVMSDLRDSGNIEQDSDLIMFIYRDEYYNPDSEKKGIAEIILAKQREGPVGMVELGFFKEYTKFVNLARK